MGASDREEIVGTGKGEGSRETGGFEILRGVRLHL